MTESNRVSRRAFLQQSALATGGLVIGFLVPGAGRYLRAQAPAAALPVPNAFLRIGADDTLTVLVSHSEMGQGIWTALPMLIAEELDADWSTIRVAHAPAAPAYAHTAYGMQMTGGSTSTWSEFQRYRQVGAMARAMLVHAAALRFGVPAYACKTENGAVIAGDKRARYGELADDAAKLPAPTSVTLKTPDQWRLIGKATKRLDTPEKITGRAEFGLDVRIEGMLTALIARAPRFGAGVTSFDATAAKAVPGVRHVVQVPSGVAVVADDFWAAKRGRDALTVQWEGGGTHQHDELLAGLRTAAGTTGAIANTAGDVAAGLEKANGKHALEYLVPYLAHAPMEPLNCCVRFADGKCEVWTGTQFQTLDQQVVAKVFGIDPTQVEIHTLFLGGGFGRRATPTSDFVTEAAHVAKAVGGPPVKTVWTREDDIRGGYYRPMTLHRIQAGTGTDGLPVAWDHAIAGQSIAAGTPFEPMMVKDGVDHTSVEGVADSPYLGAITDRRVHLHSPVPGIPVLWWRSVGHSHTGFAMESAIDELAHAANADPLAYRRRLLASHTRHLGVLNLAAEKAGWGQALPAGRARGIAVHESFASYVAYVAEVSVDAGAIRVHRMVCAIDCGIAVNPEGIAAQVESAVAFGLSAALYSRLTFADGRVRESNFHDFRVLRMNEMPQVETHIVPSTERPGGVGEPGVPPVAAAVANAVFALTGQRLRELPLQLAAAKQVQS